MLLNFLNTFFDWWNSKLWILIVLSPSSCILCYIYLSWLWLPVNFLPCVSQKTWLCIFPVLHSYIYIVSALACFSYSMSLSSCWNCFVRKGTENKGSILFYCPLKFWDFQVLLFVGNIAQPFAAVSNTVHPFSFCFCGFLLVLWCNDSVNKSIDSAVSLF